ncbi:MAG: hypothetical protein EA417_11395 [Gammaproteobacteria bacterium]|nr:MAG: hypothetical protein EA417_11395 [Gammaproteobacteria bacterium]
MNEEVAEVVAIDNGRIRLAARRVSQCGGCAARSGCGHGLLDRFGQQRVVHIELPRTSVPHDVRTGERVLLGVPDGAILAASLAVYGPLLLGLLSGALISSLLMPGADIAAVTGSGIGFIVGWLIVRRQRNLGAHLDMRCRTLPAERASVTEPRVV